MAFHSHVFSAAPAAVTAPRRSARGWSVRSRLVRSRRLRARRPARLACVAWRSAAAAVRSTMRDETVVTLCSGLASKAAVPG